MRRLLCLLLLFFSALPGFAESPVRLSDEVILRREAGIAAEVMSPFCAGRLLRDCPSSSARELRNRIREKITEGQSDDEIMTYLEGLYGDEIYAAPEFAGFGLLAWVIPPAFLFLGFLFLVYWIRSNQAVLGESELPAVDADALKDMERELSRDEL